MISNKTVFAAVAGLRGCLPGVAWICRYAADHLRVDGSVWIVISPNTAANKPCLSSSLVIISSIELQAGTQNIEWLADSTGAPAA